MNIILRTPLLVIVLIAYNIVALAHPQWLTPTTDSEMFTVTLPSNAQWVAHFSDLLLLLAVVILYFELFKSTRTDTNAIVEHILSLLVFIVFLIEFLVFEPCGTSTFLIAGLMSLIDVVAGFTITISNARRDLVLGAPTGAN